MRILVVPTIVLLILLSGCAKKEIRTGEDLDLGKLQEIANESFPGIPGLEKAFVEVYHAALIKDWEATYPYRTEAFRRSTDEGTYVATLNRDMKGYDLKDLKVLSVDNVVESSVAGSKSRVVIQSTQGAHNSSNTAVIVWTRNADGWVVDSLGLQGSPLLQNLEF